VPSTAAPLALTGRVHFGAWAPPPAFACSLQRRGLEETSSQRGHRDVPVLAVRCSKERIARTDVTCVHQAALAGRDAASCYLSRRIGRSFRRAQAWPPRGASCRSGRRWRWTSRIIGFCPARAADHVPGRGTCPSRRPVRADRTVAVARYGAFPSSLSVPAGQPVAFLQIGRDPRSREVVLRGWKNLRVGAA
jgi:hypothetical protein